MNQSQQRGMTLTMCNLSVSACGDNVRKLACGVAEMANALG
jgi:hypothetical protein